MAKERLCTGRKQQKTKSHIIHDNLFLYVNFNELVLTYTDCVLTFIVVQKIRSFFQVFNYVTVNSSLHTHTHAHTDNNSSAEIVSYVPKKLHCWFKYNLFY